MSKITTKEFLENIHQLNNLNLRFTKIIKETKKSIVVQLSGRSLNGSYVYEESQVSGYLTDLRIAFNGKVSYVGGGNVYTYGEYIFEFENKSWTEDGKKYSASGYEAFAIDYGETWALMYRMYRGLLNHGVVYKNVGLRLDGVKVYFDDKHLFTNIDYKDETHHHFKGHKTDCNRTYYHASFSCYITESEMMETYIEINKRVLEHNIKVQGDKHSLIKIYYKPCRNTSPHIVYTMTDDTFSDNFRVGDTLLVPLKKKTTRNRDLLVQHFKVGDTFIDKDKVNKDNFTITNVSYSVERGFNYGTFAKRGVSNVYSGITQIELLKIKEPTVNIEHNELLDVMGSVYFTVESIREDDDEFSYGRSRNRNPYESANRRIMCASNKLNSFSDNEGKKLINGYEIPYFIEKVLDGSHQKQIVEKSKFILSEIKNIKRMDKEATKKLKAYNKMFKGTDYGILDDEVKSIGLDIRNTQRKCERALAEGLEYIKMYGRAKRANIKLKAKLEKLVRVSNG